MPFVPYSNSKGRIEWADTENVRNRRIFSTQGGVRKVGTCNETFARSTFTTVTAEDKTPEGAKCKVFTNNSASIQVTAESPEKAIAEIEKVVEFAKKIYSKHSYALSGLLPDNASIN